jgi:hypothetical protein
MKDKIFYIDAAKGCRVVRWLLVAEPERWQNEYFKFKRKVLHSTSFKLLSQTKANPKHKCF